MIYHIFKGAPQIANPKIKEILRFYKPFRTSQSESVKKRSFRGLSERRNLKMTRKRKGV